MLLQIASFEEDSAAIEEGARHVREEVVPSIQGAEGLVAGYWAIDWQNGKRLSVMLWESPEAAAAAMPAVVDAIKRRREDAGRTTPASVALLSGALRGHRPGLGRSTGKD